VLIDLIFLPPIAEVDDSYILQKGQPYRYPPHLAVPSLPIRNASLSILNSSQTTPRVSSHRSRLLLVSSPCMSLDFSMFEVIRKPLTTSATYNKFPGQPNRVRYCDIHYPPTSRTLSQAASHNGKPFMDGLPFKAIR